MKGDVPHAVMWKYVMSPDHGFTFFLQEAAYVDAQPLTFEYVGDVFLTLNEEKKGLGRLRVTLPDGTKGLIDIMEFTPNQKKKFSEILIKTGTSLVDFHHNLLDISGYKTQLRDNTDWSHAIGKPIDYYYPYLAHFIAHGVLFESYVTDGSDEREVAFTRDVVIPTIDRLEEEYGFRPLIMRAFPENQEDHEDFYWWSYPPHVNSYILKFAEENGLEIQRLES